MRQGEVLAIEQALVAQESNGKTRARRMPRASSTLPIKSTIAPARKPMLTAGGGVMGPVEARCGGPEKARAAITF